jgi:hypothetical protein
MKKFLILFAFAFMFLSCNKKEENSSSQGLIGTWSCIYGIMGPNQYHMVVEKREFGENECTVMITEKLMTLPDSTVFYNFSRIIHSNYIATERILKSFNVRSDTNGVLEYSGKTHYELARFYGDNNTLIISDAECWRQLSGDVGQLNNSTFYLLDSVVKVSVDSSKVSVDSSKYIHYKYHFQNDYLYKYTLTSHSSEMPDLNAGWEVKDRKAYITDHTFDSFYFRQVEYYFFEGNLITSPSLRSWVITREFYRQ